MKSETDAIVSYIEQEKYEKALSIAKGLKKEDLYGNSDEEKMEILIQLIQKICKERYGTQGRKKKRKKKKKWLNEIKAEMIKKLYSFFHNHDDVLPYYDKSRIQSRRGRTFSEKENLRIFIKDKKLGLVFGHHITLEQYEEVLKEREKRLKN